MSPLPQQIAAPRVGARAFHTKIPKHRTRKVRHHLVTRRHLHPPIWVPTMQAPTRLTWNCQPEILAQMEPASTDIEPFATDFADIMTPTRGNEVLQQWIIDRHTRRARRRRQSLPPASAAPEPVIWVELVVGFGLIGAALRRARGRGYWGIYEWWRAPPSVDG